MLILWTWFWPRRWWEGLRRLPAIGYQGAADFMRSLIALSVSAWLVIGAFALVFFAYGQRQPPTVLAVLVLAPLLIWVSVIVFGFPQFLVPPGARQQADIKDMESFRQHPFLWLGLLVGLFVVAALGIWAKHH